MSDFMDEIERQAREEAEAEKAQQAEDAKYNPQVISQPGEPLEVTVEMDENASIDEQIAAMQAAARKAFPGMKI